VGGGGGSALCGWRCRLGREEWGEYVASASAERGARR